MSNTSRSKNPNPMAFVTLGGVPLRFELTWPFHASNTGADFHVLHGKAWLLSDPELGRHVEFAANVSRVIVEALPSLEPHDAEAVVINATRIAVDAGRMEFKKSAKLVPVEISSRHFNFKTNQVMFAAASQEQLRSFVQHKTYWLGYRSGKADAKVWIADPYDCIYLNNSAEILMTTAQALAQEGLLQLDGEFASATSKLAEKAATFQADLDKTLESAAAKFNVAMVEK